MAASLWLLVAANPLIYARRIKFAVPPGTRSTPNLSNATDNSEHDQQKEVMLNHDPGANQIEGDNPVPEKVLTNDADLVENHE